MSAVRRGSEWLLAALMLSFAISCAAPPGATLAVAPPRVAPGEPLRVEITVNDPGEAGAGRLDSELVDDADLVLARAQTTLRGGRAEQWLMPSRPRSLKPLRLRVWRHDGEARTLLATTRIPLEAARPIALATFAAGLHAPEDSADGRFRWSTGCAWGELEHPGTGDAMVHLRYRCPAGWIADVRLRVGGFEMAIPCPDEASTQVHLRVPRSAWGAGPLAPFEIEVREPFRPIAASGAADDRELGIRVYELLATPAG